MQPAKKSGYAIDVVLTFMTVVTISVIPNKISVLIKYAILAYLFLKYIWYFGSQKTVFSLLGIYTLVLAFSTFWNTQNLTWILSAFMTGIQLIVLFLVSAAVCQQIGKQEYLSILVKLFFVLLLMNDSLFFFIPYDFTNADESYLVGNKFLVSYYHCFFSCLIYVQTQEKKHHWLTIVLFLLCAVVAKQVNCSSGIIMAVILIAMMFIPKTLQKHLHNPTVLLSTIAVENILIWGSTNIFSHPFVKSIVVNIFHKSPNMSGRSKLYAVTLSLVKEKPLIGYGHNTDIYRILFGYGNAQNGLFHIIIQAGIIGAVVYFAAIYFALRNKNKEAVPYGLYMYLFAMVVVSAIEINLSLQFMMGIALLYGYNSDNWKKQLA